MGSRKIKSIRKISENFGILWLPLFIVRLQAKHYKFLYDKPTSYAELNALQDGIFDFLISCREVVKRRGTIISRHPVHIYINIHYITLYKYIYVVGKVRNRAKSAIGQCQHCPRCWAKSAITVLRALCPRCWAMSALPKPPGKVGHC